MANLRVAAEVAARAVHLKIFPRPADIAESREVLRVLQYYGEVETYRNLRYERSYPAPNSALAIFQDAAAARRLLKASPVRFSLEPIQQGHEITDKSNEDEVNDIGVGHEGVATTKHDAADGADLAQSASSNVVSSAEEAKSSLKSRQFKLIADLSTTNHLDHIVWTSPYQGSYKYTSGLIQDDLAKRVPLRALAEIELDRPSTPARLQRKAEERLRKRKTLRQLAEEQYKPPPWETTIPQDRVNNMEPE
ncbi:hypothetical protein M501DRAFT_1057723 [Patellaria atrata CBS 101060]|uniref:Uncharacterized protein n=1 Tax=Patellaria atrata CBS 101060 TaxID=1346257 RepID=A0A9P4SBI3_9PEZI|nr:hypothetical protein M501DRAFT_1057723 [Patellaria atrata CBS 101060]